METANGHDQKAAKVASYKVVQLGRVLINRSQCPLRSQSDRIAALQRTDAKGHEPTLGTVAELAEIGRKPTVSFELSREVKQTFGPHGLFGSS